MVGKKRDRLVVVGPINASVSSNWQDIVAECETLLKLCARFDYEMGLDFRDKKGLILLLE